MSLPNIVLITSDQHRADTLGCEGHPCVRTPHLDSLSYAGIRFTNAFSNCPLCMPARTSMITGREAHLNGCTSNDLEYRLDLPKENFLGSCITKQGYQTQLIGKTHWTLEPSFRAGFENIIHTENPPNQLWKDRFLSMRRETLLTGLGANELSPSLSLFPPELNSTQWIIDKSLEFIKNRDTNVPFFLWTSLIEPHPPNVIHEPYYSMYDDDNIPEPVMPEWAEDENNPYSIFIKKHTTNPGPMKKAELKKARSVYYGTITHLDHQLGRLFGRLQREDLWDNTLIIYTTDHGEHLGDFGAFAKSTFTQSSSRIPFIVKYPDGIKAKQGKVSEALVELADLMPTLCDFTGAEIPETVTGMSIKNIIEEKSDNNREYIHGNIDDAHMFFDGRYKYIYFANDGKELLFDTLNDKDDNWDISEQKEITSMLRNRLVKHLKGLNHKHVEDGSLLNKNMIKPDISQVKASSILNLGLGWSGRGYDE